MSFAPGQPIVMVLLGSAATGATPHDGQYLKSMDFEKHDGRGDMMVTPALKQAKVFANLEEAWNFWRRSPECKPLREDGQPNRPLTGMHWEFRKL